MKEKGYEIIHQTYMTTKNITVLDLITTNSFTVYFENILYNEAKTMHFTIFQPPIYLAYHKMCLSHIVYRINQLSLYHLT
jgi:hypothetical protein